MAERVVVTGTSGTLGRVTVRRLCQAGYDVLATDIRRSDDYMVKLINLLDPKALRNCIEGASYIVHLGGLHGRDHMSRFHAGEFWTINATGTANLYEAAIDAGLRHVVLASSMAVYGPIPSAPQKTWIYLTEDAVPNAYDIYSLTKLTSELTAQYAANRGDVATTVLRFGHFAPCDLLHYGCRLLFGGVDVRDAAEAIVTSLAHPLSKAEVSLDFPR